MENWGASGPNRNNPRSNKCNRPSPVDREALARDLMVVLRDNRLVARCPTRNVDHPMDSNHAVPAVRVVVVVRADSAVVAVLEEGGLEDSSEVIATQSIIRG